MAIFIDANEHGKDIASVLSLTNRPFQEAIVNGKTICSECYLNGNGEKNFFLKDLGLTQHFRIKHASLLLEECIKDRCKMLFQKLHGQETVRMLEELSKIRLNTVRAHLFHLYKSVFILYYKKQEIY